MENCHRVVFYERRINNYNNKKGSHDSRGIASSSSQFNEVVQHAKLSGKGYISNVRAIILEFLFSSEKLGVYCIKFSLPWKTHSNILENILLPINPDESINLIQKTPLQKHL